jgi:anti-sigma factor RsiW
MLPRRTFSGQAGRAPGRTTDRLPILPRMERAPLRPVPLRPVGPVEPGAALAHVAATLPDLDEAAREALAKVELVGSARDDVAAETGASPEAVAAALARARKALRRSMFPLSGSGWCERAERLISDRLDGELPPPGPARLEVHLSNCDRCVEHERRLAQATDRLIQAFIEIQPAPTPKPVAAAGLEREHEPPAHEERPEPEPAAPELHLVEPSPREEPEPPAVSVASEARPAAAAPLAQPAPRVTEGERSAPTATDREGTGLGARGLAWSLLIVLAALLTIAAVVVAVLGATGAIEI